MSNTTIYSEKTAEILVDGVQSQKVCDATIRTARKMAAMYGAVIVEDGGTLECYRVTRGGHRQAAPKSWTPVWESEAEQDAEVE